jgi:amino acid transporter
MSFVTTLAVQAAGLVAPLAFLIGMVAMVIGGLSFVAFERRIGSSGSVYAYIGHTFGQRWGFMAGRALLLTYITSMAGATALAGNFQ